MYQSNALLANIRRMIKLYDSMLKPVCSRYGLVPIEATIISFLFNHPGRDTAADIVELRMLSKSNVSQAVEVAAPAAAGHGGPPAHPPASDRRDRAHNGGDRKGPRVVPQKDLPGLYGGGAAAVHRV